MIARIWHGYTTQENAEAYETLLLNKIFPGIERKKVAGYKQISLFRRDIGDEVEFITQMLFDNIESVKAFAGDDYEQCVVPTEARKVLKRFDMKSQHYEIIQELSYFS